MRAGSDHDDGMTHLQRPVLALSLLGTSLLLGACNVSVTKPPTATQPTSIIGHITPAGTVDKVEEQYTGLNAPVAANGNFDLALPTAPSVPLNEASNTFGLCTSGSVSGPSGFKSLAITTLQGMKGSAFVAEYVSPLNTTSGISYRAWWYANMAGTVTAANADCVGFGSVNQSLTFKKGWNVMDVTVTGASTSITRATNQTPGRLIWKNKNSVQSLEAQSLNPYLFNPWAALRQ